MFIDTNVLVNSRVPRRPAPRRGPGQSGTRLPGPGTAQDQPPDNARVPGRGHVRPQTWPVALTREEALDDVGRLAGSFEILEDGPPVTELLLALCREVPAGGRQIHDANIVATMLARGERRLLTFNTADFRRYG